MCGSGRGRVRGRARSSVTVKLSAFMKETGAPLLVCQGASSSESGAHSAAPLSCEITVSIAQLFECNVHKHVHLYCCSS